MKEAAGMLPVQMYSLLPISSIMMNTIPKYSRLSLTVSCLFRLLPDGAPPFISDTGAECRIDS